MRQNIVANTVLHLKMHLELYAHQWVVILVLTLFRV